MMNQLRMRLFARSVAVACVVTATGLLLATPVTAALVHQYTFNDGTADDSIGGQDGTVVDPGSPTAVFGAGRLDLSANTGEPSNGMNEDGEVNGLDVDPFVAAVVGGGVAAVPEPTTLTLLVVLTLGALTVFPRKSQR